MGSRSAGAISSGTLTSLPTPLSRSTDEHGQRSTGQRSGVTDVGASLMTEQQIRATIAFLRRVVPRGAEEEDSLVSLILLLERALQQRPERG